MLKFHNACQGAKPKFSTEKKNTTQHVSITNLNSAKSLTIRYIYHFTRTDYKSFFSNLFLSSIFRGLPSKYILN